MVYTRRCTIHSYTTNCNICWIPGKSGPTPWPIVGADPYVTCILVRYLYLYLYDFSNKGYDVWIHITAWLTIIADSPDTLLKIWLGFCIHFSTTYPESLVMILSQWYYTTDYCWLVVKLGTPQDRRPDRSDERQKGDCARTKGEGEISILFPSFLTPH